MITIFKASIALMLVLTLGVLSACAPGFDDTTPLKQESLLDNRVSLLMPESGIEDHTSSSEPGVTFTSFARRFQNVEIGAGVWQYERGVLGAEEMSKLEAFDMMKGLASEIAKGFAGKLSETKATKVPGALYAFRARIISGKDPATNQVLDADLVLAMKVDRIAMCAFSYAPGSVGVGTVSKVLDSFEMK